MNKTTENHLARERFAVIHGMTSDDVAKLCYLHRKAGRLGEYICNGEPRHAENRVEYIKGDDGAWKSENSRLWGLEQNKIDVKILKLVEPFGFDKLEYNGLFPTLIKGGRDVYVPE